MGRLLDAPTVEPDLGLGDVDLIIPDNAVTMALGMCASDDRIVL